MTASGRPLRLEDLQVAPRRARTQRILRGLFLAAALLAIVISVGIILSLLDESIAFITSLEVTSVGAPPVDAVEAGAVMFFPRKLILPLRIAPTLASHSIWPTRQPSSRKKWRQWSVSMTAPSAATPAKVARLTMRNGCQGVATRTARKPIAKVSRMRKT